VYGVNYIIQVLMKSKILPITYPSVQTWQWQANMLAILECYAECEAWIYSNLIQLVSNRGNDTCNIISLPDYNCFDYCPFLFVQHIKRELIERFMSNETIVDFFKNAIAEGNYIYGLFDESEFLEEDKPFHHDLFIYGYDDNEERFHVADFTFTGKYSFEKVSYNEIQSAYYGVARADDDFYQGMGGLLLISKKKANYGFDSILVEKTINEYLTSVNSINAYRSIKNPSKWDVYGLDVYTMVSEFWDEVSRKEAQPDFRNLHNIYSSQILMIKRLEYMMENGYLDRNTNMINLYKGVSDKTLILRNRAIYADITNNYDSYKIVSDRLLDIRDEEKSILENVVKNIKTKRVEVEYWR